MTDYGQVDIQELIKKVDTLEVDFAELKKQLRESASKTFATHLKEVMNLAGETPATLAEKTGFKRQTIHYYCGSLNSNGTITVPSIVAFNELQRVLPYLDRKIWAKAKAQKRIKKG